MAVQEWQVFDISLEMLGEEHHDIENDTLKIALIDSSWTPNMATDVDFAVIDGDEVVNAGYAAGGATVANVSWDTAAGVLAFDGDDVEWTAGAGGITARRALLWNSSAGGSNDIIATCLLDDTPADVTAPVGTDLVLELHASGILTETQV